MRKLLLSLVVALSMAALAVPAFATNGTNIIGVGAISRSMGGVGAAAPQDAITAVFGNPAAMCYIPCESSEVDFAATLFMPEVKAQVTVPTLGGPFSVTAKSQGQPYAFPAIGIYTPINEKLRFGLAAYGVSGLGVDYKDSELDAIDFGIRTQLSIMKFAPNIAYMILPNLSVGAALQLNWAQLDLGDGDTHDFGIGTQIGVIYKPVKGLSLGVTYQSPQKHNFNNVYDLNGNGDRDTLSLEQPQQVVVGLAYEVVPDIALVEVNGKWYNWSDAAGYSDFGWKDQYIIAVGAQVKPVDWLALRVGYNYGNNPVKEHNGWNPGDTVSVEGKSMPTYIYEGFRVVGFPAIVEHHITCGVGINITPKVSLNAGYMHAFHKTISESSMDLGGGAMISYQSSLAENSYEFGLNIMF
jgi:long-chain fatty acid transport protein